MSNKIFVGIIVAVLVIAGYVLLKNMSEKQEATETENNVSFLCEDGSGFIAGFNNKMSEVRIIVAGEVLHTLPNTGDESVPYRFEDEERSYIFVGEEVVVTDSEPGTSVVCTQPIDQNNAPYNFGDTGEEAETEQYLAAAATENILGSWQSTDDPAFVREFRNGGVIVDHYEGTENTEGNWSAFTSASGIETPFPQTDGAVYLRVVMKDFPEEILYFELARLTPEDLELFFLGRGGVLAFKKVGG